MMLLSDWNRCAGGLWKELEEWSRENLACCKWSLKRDSEDKNSDRNVDSKGDIDEVSDGNEDPMGN
jgi:hypothetical protein